MIATGKSTSQQRQKDEEYQSEMQSRIQSMAMGEGIKYGAADCYLDS